MGSISRSPAASSWGVLAQTAREKPLCSRSSPPSSFPPRARSKWTGSTPCASRSRCGAFWAWSLPGNAPFTGSSRRGRTFSSSLGSTTCPARKPAGGRKSSLGSSASLSSGMRKRLAIARALIHRPSVLILDEPTAGLDPQGVEDVWRILRELPQERITVLNATHNMLEAERLPTRLLIIDEGRLIAQGTAPEIMARAKAERTAVLTLGSQPKIDDGLLTGSRPLVPSYRGTQSSHRLRGSWQAA
ncbi:MAG: ATP-binding cassette domain-containing protein [Candidatus Bipolaricaulis sp.]|nr:ATP-binding cassette domain-containing protein [Candidatus Bipolaricaulis sp.]